MTMTISERVRRYREWLDEGSFGGEQLWSVADRMPAWDRAHADSPVRAERDEAARHGFNDFCNAAALRQATQGEGEDRPRQVCTGCDRETTGDLVPWSGERLCWDCTDFQLDLLAKACQDQLPVSVGHGIGGVVTRMEVDFDLRANRRLEAVR